LASADSDAAAGTVGDATVVVAASVLDAILAWQAAEAVLAAPINWTEINAAYPESTANRSFLDATDFIGAVNPDVPDARWAGWTVPGSF
jgi:hypothetical protein